MLTLALGSGTLVDSNLWAQTDEGYQIADWLGCKIEAEPDTQELRKSRDYERWREAVLERDGLTCQGCRATSVVLHAHHILTWSAFPAQRFDQANGITLCKWCHGRAHGRAQI